MKEEIIKMLKESEIPLTEIDIQNRLNEKITLEALCDELRNMEKCGEVYVTKKNK